MNGVWILHREARERAAIARLAGVGAAATLAAPGEPALAVAPRADVVILGLSGNFEAELQCAHRFADRLRDARVAVLVPAGEIAHARALFDTLDADFLGYPPDAAWLRAFANAPGTARERGPLPLSQRPARDALADRFSRCFADLELPDLLRILDPQQSEVRLLIEGEAGSGRALLTRYLHTFGGGGGPLIQVVCDEGASAESLLDQISSANPALRDAPQPHCTIWLEDVERLPHSVQLKLRSWIDFAPPPGALRCSRLRWVGTSLPDAAGLTPALAAVLSGFRLRIPPLRERADAIPTLATASAQSWCAEHARRTRSFAPDALQALVEYPWPGNFREFDAVVARSLTASAEDPIPASALRHDDAPFAPVTTADLGAVLADDDDEVVLESFLEEDFDEFEGAAAPAEAAHLPEEPKPATPAESAPSVGVAVVPRQPSEIPGVSLRRWMGAVTREVGNPLTTIRTFAELFPDQYLDPEFRQNFVELVGRGVDRIEKALDELSDLASLDTPQSAPVDVAGLLEELLEVHRETIHARRLVVLKELDKSQPLALGDAGQLRFALDGLLRKCLEVVPERGDVYFASRHHDGGLRGRPALRVLVRFHGASGGSTPSGSPVANALEFLVAETVVRAQGGAIAIQAADADESLLVIDLPAPS